MTLRFNSKIQEGATLPEFTQEQVKNEVMLFSASFEFANRVGGPLTRAFLQSLPIDWALNDTIIDSRVHMLMPGWWPCISGWHHDDIPRTREDNQPNYDNPEYHAEHALALVNGEVAPTEFALGKSEFPEVPIGQTIYKIWHPIVEQQLKEGKLTKFVVPSNQIVYFDAHSWHQGVQAKKNGWRWFIRASKNTGRKPSNEIRRQVQVYLPAPFDGW